MARSSMADLIGAVRSLIADPAGAVFDDDAIQAALDETRLAYRYFPLREEITYPHPERVSQYFTYHAPDRGWEANYEITDRRYAQVPDLGSEPTVGTFRFEESQDPPLYISGHTYDVFEAAGRLCEQWAQRVALEFDFSNEGGSFTRNQKQATLRDMAKTFRSQAKPARMALTRYDEEG